MQRVSRAAARMVVIGAALLALPAARAEAQVVQGCQPDQYLDRTAAGADRQITWDFSIVTDPERCLQVKVGQTVVWTGDFDTHPLAGQGGDNPNPIGLHVNGAVTFTNAGTFGFHCLNHSVMVGAIKVVAATAAPSVPALSPWLAVALTVLLLATGFVLLRKRVARRRPT